MERIQLPAVDCEAVNRESGFAIRQVALTGATGCVVGPLGRGGLGHSAALIRRAFARHTAAGYQLVGYILPSTWTRSTTSATPKPSQPSWAFAAKPTASNPRSRASAPPIPRPLKPLPPRQPDFPRARQRAVDQSRHRAQTPGGNRQQGRGLRNRVHTLFGDGAVHMSPIGGLSKRLVREIGENLGLPDVIVNRTPTAGLEPGRATTAIWGRLRRGGAGVGGFQPGADRGRTRAARPGRSAWSSPNSPLPAGLRETQIHGSSAGGRGHPQAPRAGARENDHHPPAGAVDYARLISSS